MLFLSGRAKRLPIAFVLFAVISVLGIRSTFAHIPHDGIGVLDLSPSSKGYESTYTAVSGLGLLKSVNGRYVSFMFAVFAILSVLGAKTIFAHSPHDIIEALDISPSYNTDKTAFISVPRTGLQKSVDGGYSWKLLVRGLDNRSAFSCVAVSPSYREDQTVYVSTEGDGVYRSRDGGASWVKVNNGLGDLNVRYLWVSPDYAADRALFAAGSRGGLYRTRDGGDKWYAVMESGVAVGAMAFLPDKRVVAGDGAGRILHSIDGGGTWQEGHGFRDSGSVTSIAFSRDKGLFVGTESGGIFRSEDWGESYVEVNRGLENKPIQSLAFSPGSEGDSTLYASTWHEAVYQSKDGGGSWQLFSKGVTKDKQADSEQYKSPHFRELRVSNAFGEDKTIFLAGFDGLFKSTDGGQTWEQMETMPVRLITSLGVSAAGEGKSALALATGGAGVYITTDQGRSWTAKNRGLRRFEHQYIAFSPSYSADQMIFLVSETDFSVCSGLEGNWKTEPFTKAESRTLRLVRTAFHKLRLRIPDFLRTFQPKPDIIAVSPSFESDRTIFFGTRYDGVYRSTDRTLTWSAVWEGQPISYLAISPAFSTDATLFASVRGKGVYKTTDGGVKWHAVNTGLASGLASPAQGKRSRTTLDLTMMDVQLATSPNYRADQTVFAGSQAGLHKTEDGGTSWHRLNVLGPEEPAFVQAIAVSPEYARDRAVFVSVRGKGLFRSADGGRTFAETGSDLIARNYCLKWIVFSPSYAVDRTLYGASDEEVFRSTDGGERWELMPRPARYEDSRKVIRYDGDWKELRGEEFSGSSVMKAEVAGSRASLTFVGRGITVVGCSGRDQGTARVLIDGKQVAEVDQFSEQRKTMTPTYSISGLPPGHHAVSVEVAGSKNPQSTGYRIEIDAFDVLP